jgi:hypothetical protein
MLERVDHLELLGISHELDGTARRVAVDSAGAPYLMEQLIVRLCWTGSSSQSFGGRFRGQGPGQS